jgi:CDGSH-type Zn-finger protein
MADQPIVAGKTPHGIALKAGERKAWCRCGHSKDQPFCDGSHKGTGITPVVFTAEKDGDVYLCMCKCTGNAPHCDGTHKTLDDVNVGDPVPEKE